MGERLPVVCRGAVFLGDGWAFSSGHGFSFVAGRPFCSGVGDAPPGPTSLWHDLSTCCVWWHHSYQEVVTVWVCLRDPWAYSSGVGGGPQRSDGTLARIVDVLGVAAPHGPAVVWYATRRVHARMGPDESECSAWDAWTNPAAEANDPISLVSEYAACGVWRPHMALPFSRMSLVAYLRGWVARVVPRGLTALWHELSTCWVWRRHMVRPLYAVGGKRAK
ncbi:hypothetical protein TGRUB_433900 [Toxoplasma gondii RUB]|uniref:Uncharacterized protein n=1 Tax=Toxoplasma gondii RUB TaxID=935652 RepID=A0A086LJ52_TOXGO|nr:hypothetical protein TGRUB_433900 [Toxoplasma gondii RUB]